MFTIFAFFKAMITVGLILSTLAVTCFFSTPANAYGELQDEYSLQIKGFSRELITPVQAQINRMEGRYPAKKPSRLKQTWYNFLNSEWVESTEPFTYDTIDAPPFSGSGSHL